MTEFFLVLITGVITGGIAVAVMYFQGKVRTVG
jgi:hypothetical protein